MRVLVYPEKQYEEFGARRWDVSTEFVKKSAMGKDDIDMDSDIEYVHRPCKTREAALDAAKKLVAHERIAFGAVRIQEQVVDWFVEEDRVAEWADVGEGEEFCHGDFYREAQSAS